MQISLAVSLLSQTATTVTYLANVSTTSYSGTVNLGVQSGTCAQLLGTPTQQVPAVTGRTISLSTAACPPGTNTTLTFTAGNGTVQADPETVLLQTATMLSPTPGSIIPGGATTFNWATVAGATQYSLSAGSTFNGTDIYSNPSLNVQAQSVSIPTACPTVYARLGTFVNGVWQYQSYVYYVNATPNMQAPQLTSGPTSAKVASSGKEVQYTYRFANGDARTITGVSTNIGLGARIVSATASTLVVAYKATPRQFSTSIHGQVTFSGPYGPVGGGPAEGLQGPGFTGVSPSEFRVWQSGDPAYQDFTITNPDIPADGWWPYANLQSDSGGYSEVSGLGGSTFSAMASFPWPTVAGHHYFWLTGEVCWDPGCEYSEYLDGPPADIIVDPVCTPVGGSLRQLSGRDTCPVGGPTVTGTVTNLYDGSFVQGVTITDSNGGGTATTDATGTYSIATRSTNDILTPSKSGWRFNPTQSQANVSTINFIGTPVGTVPSITAITPSTTTPVQASNDVLFSINGSNLVSSNASGVVFTDGSGNPDQSISFNVSRQSETLIEGTIELASGVSSGAHSFYVASANGNSNTLTLTVQADPVITSVSPSTFNPGEQGISVTISGQNFGAACSGSMPVTICASGAVPCTQTSDITIAALTACTPTSISATFNVGQGADGDYDVMVGTDSSAGGMISGYVANQQTLGSNRKPVQVTGTKITVSGVVLANGKPLKGIQILALAQYSSASAKTKGDGSYSLQMTRGSSFTMTAQFSYPYTIPISADGPTNGNFTAVQADQKQNFSAGHFTTVYLLHGLGQDHTAMAGLALNLTGQGGVSGLDTSRFLVDFSYDYGECAPQGCSSNCSISAAAQKFAGILKVSPFTGPSPGWDMIIIGYSMGGLVARDLLVNSAAYGVVPSGNMRGLVTLGTPNYGYPWVFLDSVHACIYLTDQLRGIAYSNGPNLPPVGPSTYLMGLSQLWTAASYGGFWIAAAGRFCSNNERYYPDYGVVYAKCPQPNGVYANDGVVCADSAEYSWVPGLAGRPTVTFDDPSHKYSHTDAAWGLGTFAVMGDGRSCRTSSSNGILSNPLASENPFKQIVGAINATNGN